MPVDLHGEDRELQAKSDGDGELPMGPPDHDQIPMFLRQGGKSGLKVLQTFQDEMDGLHHLQGICRIDDIVGCGTEMDVAPCVPALLAECFHHGHEIMSDLGLDLLHMFEGYLSIVDRFPDYWRGG